MHSFSEKKERLQQLKKEYRWLYTSFKMIFVQDDPKGLIRMGAPDDEYEFEVAAILARIGEARSADELGKIMYEVFAKAFDNKADLKDENRYQMYKPRYALLGEEGWQEWTRWKEERGEK